jgi:hypothetical protein
MSSARELVPGRLWSLLDIMERFHASVLFDVCRAATAYSLRKGDHEEISEAARLRQAISIGNYIDNLHPLGLSASCASLRKMKEKFETAGCKKSEIGHLSEEFLGRLRVSVPLLSAGRSF